MASAHTRVISGVMSVVVETASRQPLSAVKSAPVKRGPASTMFSLCSAFEITEALGPCPIGLRETTSAPMRRAATRALKVPPVDCPRSVAHTSPPYFGYSVECMAWSTRSAPRKRTRPGCPPEQRGMTGGLTGSK